MFTLIQLRQSKPTLVVAAAASKAPHYTRLWKCKYYKVLLMLPKVWWCVLEVFGLCRSGSCSCSTVWKPDNGRCWIRSKRCMASPKTHRYEYIEQFSFFRCNKMTMVMTYQCQSRGFTTTTTKHFLPANICTMWTQDLTAKFLCRSFSEREMVGNLGTTSTYPWRHLT